MLILYPGGLYIDIVFQPIGDGPIMNKMGRAIVQMLVSGVETEYAIQAQPVDHSEEFDGKLDIEAPFENEENFKTSKETSDAI